MMAVVSEKIARFDRSGVLKVYKEWPEHCRDAWSISVNIPKIDRIDQIILGGMGGSATSADIIFDWSFDKISIPVTVVKGFDPPAFLGKNTLVIVISCSGDTEESLSLTKAAFRKGAYLATISSGGLLQKFSKSNGIPHTKVKKILMPRYSLPYLLFPALKILEDCDLIKVVKEVRDSLKSLEKIRYLSENLNHEALNLAEQLVKGFPLLYASELNRAVAFRAKDCFNENAKIHSAVEIMPECCHNDIQGWRKDDQTYIKPILLRSKMETGAISRRFEFMKNLIAEKGFQVHEVYGEGNSHLSEIVTSIYYLDLVTVFAAIIRGLDPAPTPHIDRLKESLKK